MADNELPFNAVQVDALVVMKLIQHGSNAYPAPSTGSLVGLEQDGVLEITNSFPFPVADSAADSHSDGPSQSLPSAVVAPRARSSIVYEREMIKIMETVNVDANNVGWFLTTNMGNFINHHFVENQCRYQSELNEKSVALVHDVSRTSHGSLNLRAFRLSPQFMTAFKENKFTSEQVQKSGFLKNQDLFIELPVQIHNSHLLASYISQYPSLLPQPQLDLPTSVDQLEKGPAALSTPNFDPLSVNIDPFLEKNCSFLLDSIETHQSELNNYQYYQRAFGREQTKISQWQAKRKSENASRAAIDQPPLPEDEWQRLFKLPQEPSRLESLLNTKQAELYAQQVDVFASATTGKMFAIKGNQPSG